MISLHNMLPFELTKDTPYLALSGELWSVFYEYFNRNWSCYKGFLLYMEHVYTHGPGTRTASRERERHTCKPGHKQVHKGLKHRHYELTNISWLSFWLVVTDWWMGKNVNLMNFSMQKEVGPTGISEQNT